MLLRVSGPLPGTNSETDDLINAVMKVYDYRDMLNSI